MRASAVTGPQLPDDAGFDWYCTTIAAFAIAKTSVGNGGILVHTPDPESDPESWSVYRTLIYAASAARNAPISESY